MTPHSRGAIPYQAKLDFQHVKHAKRCHRRYAERVVYLPASLAVQHQAEPDLLHLNALRA